MLCPSREFQMQDAESSRAASGPIVFWESGRCYESRSTFIMTNLAYKPWLWLPWFRLHAGKKRDECDYDGKG
jgi:hypothetical protein